MGPRPDPHMSSRSMASRKQAQPASCASRRDSGTDLQPLIALIGSLNDALEQKAAHYIPIAEHLVENRSRNHHEIEHILDHLLDVACLPDGLTAFKSLCRRYWEINPQATAGYVRAYRDMWDSDGAPDQELAS
jgi:hypothetical protein